MPLSYEIDSELGIVRIKVEGDPSISEQTALAVEWTQDPSYRAGMHILLDNRLRSAPSDREHIAEAASKSARSFLEKGTRCAVVVATDVEFGMTRMFASMSDAEPLVTKPFRDISAAEQWLISGIE